jgi:beta-fructofuranosidase
MGLRLEDKWIWDLWLAVDGPDYHGFYLQAPSGLGDPELRHRHVSIGHAVSQDLHNWEVLPDALRPAQEAGAWDDFTTWTGSVIRHDGQWHMFYTGGRQSENSLIERIGLAISQDLIHWERHPDNPVILCDPERYETLDQEDWDELTWRDPWLMPDAQSDGFLAFIAARSKMGPVDGRGLIALARSPDLKEWQVADPVTQSGDFACMEVPQVVQINHRWYLMFSAVAGFQSGARRARVQAPAETGIYYLAGESQLGPYRPTTDACLLGPSTYTFYGGKILRDPSGNWVLLPMRYLDRTGRFVGEMHDPIPVRATADGQLTLDGVQQASKSTP